MDCHRGTVYRYPDRWCYRELRIGQLVEKTGLSGTDRVLGVFSVLCAVC